MVEVTTWVALGLILGGMLLIFLEVMNPGFFIAVVGTVMIVMGVLVWIMGTAVFAPWGAMLTVGIAIAASWGTLAVYRHWAPPSDRPVTIAKDSLPGMEGRVEQTIHAGGRGEVRIAGQRWHATADVDLSPGAYVRVREVDGLTLVVEPSPSSRPPPPVDLAGAHAPPPSVPPAAPTTTRAPPATPMPGDPDATPATPRDPQGPRMASASTPRVAKTTGTSSL